MDAAELALYFAYNRWANEKVLAACRLLEPAALHAPARCSFGSLMGTLAHIYGAERSWRLRLEEGVSPGRLPTGAEFSTLEGLEEQWREEEAKMRRFVEGLAPETVGRWVEYTTTGGKAQGSTLWRALMHLILHGVQFRGEAGAVLAGFGHSPGDLDFILYQRETDQR